MYGRTGARLTASDTTSWSVGASRAMPWQCRVGSTGLSAASIQKHVWCTHDVIQPRHLMGRPMRTSPAPMALPHLRHLCARGAERDEQSEMSRAR